VTTQLDNLSFLWDYFSLLVQQSFWFKNMRKNKFDEKIMKRFLWENKGLKRKENGSS